MAQVQVKRLETGSLMATLEIPGIAVLHLLHYMAEDMINANLSKLGVVVIEIGLMPRINIGKECGGDSVAASRDLCE